VEVTRSEVFRIFSKVVPLHLALQEPANREKADLFSAVAGVGLQPDKCLINAYLSA